MRKTISLTIVVLLAFAGGCKQKTHEEASVNTPPESAQTAQASAQLSPEQLGELGAQIQKSPDRANALLTQHGLTPQTYESQIRKITENPDESKRYAAAYRKAHS